MLNIAVVVPTCREKQIEVFKSDWSVLFDFYNVHLIVVHDGDEPWLEIKDKKILTASDIMKENRDLISNRISAIRNLGFAYIAKEMKEVDYVITLDDDLNPVGDPIGDHLEALQMKVPISWMRIGSEYTRGFPYGVREEAEVVFSHGVWTGIKDYDAPTQLARGNPDMEFYKMPIPKGVLFPTSGMNVAFKRKALPFMYWAHREDGIARFDDIFMGINAKREFDKKNWAMVTGYARVEHNRMSNVYKNLQGEAIGLELNEGYWMGIEKHPYFKEYNKKRERWIKLIKSWLKS